MTISNIIHNYARYSVRSHTIYFKQDMFPDKMTIWNFIEYILEHMPASANIEMYDDGYEMGFVIAVYGKEYKIDLT